MPRNLHPMPKIIYLPVIDPLKWGHAFMHSRMGLEPLLDLQFRLGEGTGAALAFQILEAATRILAEIKTFEEVAIKNAQLA